MLNVTPQLPPKKNIAYFGAETKTKKLRPEMASTPRGLRPHTRRQNESEREREREQAESERDNEKEAERASVKVGRLGAQSRR